MPKTEHFPAFHGHPERHAENSWMLNIEKCEVVCWRDSVRSSFSFDPNEASHGANHTGEAQFQSIYLLNGDMVNISKHAGSNQQIETEFALLQYCDTIFGIIEAIFACYYSSAFNIKASIQNLDTSKIATETAIRIP